MAHTDDVESTSTTCDDVDEICPTFTPDASRNGERDKESAAGVADAGGGASTSAGDMTVTTTSKDARSRCVGTSGAENSRVRTSSAELWRIRADGCGGWCK